MRAKAAVSMCVKQGLYKRKNSLITLASMRLGAVILLTFQQTRAGFTESVLSIWERDDWWAIALGNAWTNGLLWTLCRRRFGMNGPAPAVCFTVTKARSTVAKPFSNSYTIIR